MKYTILPAFVLSFVSVSAQIDPFVSNINPTNVAGLEPYDITGKKIPTGREVPVNGSYMLNEHFEKGVVKFKNGQQVKDVLLNLSLLNNQLYFKQDTSEMVFILPVDQFVIPVAADGQYQPYLFKNGYPPIKNQTGKTFYQVLCDGLKLQLLKYAYKTPQERYQYGTAGKNEYKLEERLFVFNVLENKILEINKNEKSVIKSLPGFQSAIQKFQLQHNVKFTKNEELVSLIDFINKS